MYQWEAPDPATRSFKPYGKQGTQADYHMSGDNPYGAIRVADHAGQPTNAGAHGESEH